MHFGFNRRFEFSLQDIHIKIDYADVIHVDAKVVHCGGSYCYSIFPFNQQGYIAASANGISVLGKSLAVL
jgi:hypothetical protein